MCANMWRHLVKATDVTTGLAESNGSLVPVDRLKSPAGWLPVHRDQFRAQRFIVSMALNHSWKVGGNQTWGGCRFLSLSSFSSRFPVIIHPTTVPSTVFLHPVPHSLNPWSLTCGPGRLWWNAAEPLKLHVEPSEKITANVGWTKYAKSQSWRGCCGDLY